MPPIDDHIYLPTGTQTNLLIDVLHVFLSTHNIWLRWEIRKLNLSHGFASVSDITPGNKLD